MRAVVVRGGGGCEDIVSGLRIGWPGCEAVSAPFSDGVSWKVPTAGVDLAVVQAGKSERQEWLSLIRKIRQTFTGVVVVVASRESDTDLIEALDAGADDYFSLPLNRVLFVVRVRAALRRLGGISSSAVQPVDFEDLTVDAGRHEVVCRDRVQDFTATEFKILLALVEGRDLVTTKDDLCSALWGRHGKSEDDALRKHVQVIRQKLRDTSCSVCVETVTGVGYRLLKTERRQAV